MDSSLDKKMGMETAKEDVGSELPAPAGWKKKLISKKVANFNENEIIFISPAGEEISNRKQLNQYLKAHPGGPALSQFDWGTGQMPRRSLRISERAKAAPPPLESEPLKKRGRKSSASKKDNNETRASSAGTEGTKEVDMKEAEISEKDNAEVGVKKDVKEKEDDKKDEGQDVNAKTETAPPETAKVGEGVNTSNDAEAGNKSVEAETEKLNEKQAGLEADGSGQYGKNEIEGGKVEENAEEPQVEAEKEPGSGEKNY